MRVVRKVVRVVRKVVSTCLCSRCFSQAAAVPEEEDGPLTIEDIKGWFERCVKPLYTDDSSPTWNQVLDSAQEHFNMEFHNGMTEEARTADSIIYSLHTAAERQACV